MHTYYVSDAKFYLYYLQLSQQCCKLGITPNLPMRKMRLGEVVTKGQSVDKLFIFSSPGKVPMTYVSLSKKELE